MPANGRWDLIRRLKVNSLHDNVLLLTSVILRRASSAILKRTKNEACIGVKMW